MHTATERFEAPSTAANISERSATYNSQREGSRSSAALLFRSSAARICSFRTMGPKPLFDDEELLPHEQPAELHVNEEYAKRFEASVSAQTKPLSPGLSLQRAKIMLHVLEIAEPAPQLPPPPPAAAA